MAVEKSTFLSSNCEPEDVHGELTSCFIEHLGYKPLTAAEARELTFKSSQEKIERQISPILALIRSESERGHLGIYIPGSYSIGKSHAGAFMDDHGYKLTSNGQDPVVNIETWWINTLHVRALTELGYNVERMGGEMKRYSIKWDNDNTETS